MHTYTIGVDVGGTKIRAGLISSVYKIIKTVEYPTPVQSGAKAVSATIEKAVAELFSKDVKKIGVGIAGLVDTKKGVFYSGPNLPKTFRNIKLENILKKRFRVPVTLENDARCFTLAETVLGAGKGYKTVVGITLGTGVGGGIVIDQKIFRGKDGIAGEFGHMTIIENGRLCSCGEKGHVEAYASGTAIAKNFAQLTKKNIKALEIENLSNNGDKNAQQVEKEATEALTILFTNIIYTINPDIIVVGGGIAKWRKIWQNASHNAQKGIMYSEIKKIRVVAAKNGSDAGVLGAAIL